MTFNFPPGSEIFAASISAVIKIGEDFWLAGDEGTSIMMFRKSGVFGETALQHGGGCDLLKALDLPVQTSKKKGESPPEVDLEGMDWDPVDGYLWLVGSHSLKRKAAKDGQTAAETRSRIATITADGNRFLLGRIPLRVTQGQSEVVSVSEQTVEHFAARISCTDHSSELLEALKTDTLIGPFLAAGLPSKDNGLDIEGLAWDGARGRLLLGLRGPVLRGMAILIEIELAEEYKEGAAGTLHLQPIGPEGQLYRQHFLDLDGLGIRDLCFQEGDLLILAGPTQGIDWPVCIYRWKGASDSMASGECHPRQETSELQLVRHDNLPYTERGYDHPESLTPCGASTFLVVCDSPSSYRYSGNVLAGDLIDISVMK